MSWGKRGFVGIRKAIWQHEQTLREAERILKQEHGIRHKPGEHSLCPLCNAIKVSESK